MSKRLKTVIGIDRIQNGFESRRKVAQRRKAKERTTSIQKSKARELAHSTMIEMLVLFDSLVFKSVWSLAFWLDLGTFRF